MRDRIVRESQLPDRMSIAVEREQAAGVESLPREDVRNVLAMPVSIDLDRDAPLRRLGKDPRGQSAATPFLVLYTRP